MQTSMSIIDINFKTMLMIPKFYITFKVDNITRHQTASARIQACIKEIRTWMILHKLMVARDIELGTTSNTIFAQNNHVPERQTAVTAAPIGCETACLPILE